MGKQHRHRSVNQNYIDLSDRLAALRSVKELVYAAIITALAVSFAMYVFFDIVPARGSFSSGTEDVSVLIQVRFYDVQEDDILVLKKGRLCAAVMSPEKKLIIPGQNPDGEDDRIPVMINNQNGSKQLRLVSPGEIEGKIGFVVFPLNRFGEDIRKLF